MSKRIFQPSEILLPKQDSLEKWSVIACDQFTSDPEYWKNVEELVGTTESSLRLILPEFSLQKDNSDRIAEIHSMMRKYHMGEVFDFYDNALIYVERTLKNGNIRPGIVGVIDLEEYDYSFGANTSIRPTEKTVLERIPPRKMVRSNASLELSHTILFYSDEQDRLVNYIHTIKEHLRLLYDFDLMMGGGHISGWLLQGEYVEKIINLFLEYQVSVEERGGVILAVGDGNHSLATAKSCWEDTKKQLTRKEWSGCPERFAMVEIENLFDQSLEFEPIHRLVTKTNPVELIGFLQHEIGCKEGYPIPWVSGSERGYLFVKVLDGDLPLTVLQDALDKWVRGHSGEIDYIHGEKSLIDLTMETDSVGFILPKIEKEHFFQKIGDSGVMPRKTFSIGHAEEKRYYLESRVIEKI